MTTSRGMLTAKEAAKRALRRVGFSVHSYRFTVPARKQQLLDHFGVDLLVDVGANKGQAAALYRQNGFKGRILSIEPDQRSIDVIQIAAARDPRWDVKKAAVGAQHGEMTLHLSEESQFTSLVGMAAATTEASPRARYIGADTVEVHTLDAIAKEESCASLGLKIDVQGFEEQVLAGGTETLARANYVDIELCVVELYQGQILMLELMRRMEDLGFGLALIEDTYSDMRTGRCLAFNGVYGRF